MKYTIMMFVNPFIQLSNCIIVNCKNNKSTKKKNKSYEIYVI